MSKNIVHRILADAYHYVTHRGFGFKKWKKQFAYFGEGACIDWPAIVSTGRGLSIGEGTRILSNSRILNVGDEKSHIYIGKRCFLGYYLTILNASTVTIGDDVLFASHVIVSSENHGIDPESEIPYMEQPLVSKPISIGDGCWVGEKVCILPGVSIGKKCIVGAGSVVTKSIPDYSIAVGNPARVIKQYNFQTHNWEKV